MAQAVDALGYIHPIAVGQSRPAAAVRCGHVHMEQRLFYDHNDDDNFNM